MYFLFKFEVLSDLNINVKSLIADLLQKAFTQVTQRT